MVTTRHAWHGHGLVLVLLRLPPTRPRRRSASLNSPLLSPLLSPPLRWAAPEEEAQPSASERVISAVMSTAELVCRGGGPSQSGIDVLALVRYARRVEERELEDLLEQQQQQQQEQEQQQQRRR